MKESLLRHINDCGALENYIIRPSEPTDYDAVNSMAVSLLEQEPMSREAFDTVHCYSASHKKATMVAESQSGILGYGSVQPYQQQMSPDPFSRTTILAQLAVKEDFRGQGIGAALLEEATSAAAAFGSALLVAGISSSSAPFYKRLGWTVLPPGCGLGFIEAEAAYDKDAFEESHVVRLLSEAATIRGFVPSGSKQTEFDRFAYYVLDEKSVVKVFRADVTPTNPMGYPGAALVDSILADHSVLMAMPLSVVLTVTPGLLRRVGQLASMTLIDSWLRENPLQAAVAPARLGAPGATAQQVFAYLFANTSEESTA